MEVYQLIRRGEMHKEYCEDFLLASQLNEQYSIYGVFDGCSSGIDSHLASALLAKIVRAEMHMLVDEPVHSIKELLCNTVFNVMKSLRKIKTDLLLETDELLSTMVLLVIDKFSKMAKILVFGDGFVSINGKSFVINQNNVPDYLAYHLDDLETIDDFDSWLAEHSKLFDVAELEDVSISTDGIDSFQMNQTQIDAEEINPADYLLKNTYLLHNKSMLARKCNILRTRHYLINQDDIAMIRIIV